MPDILIRGMEMPKTCAICKIRSCNSYCPLNIEIKFFFDPSNTGFDFCTGRHSDCPLHELPPHGDLIDRDQLAKTLDYYIREAGWGDEINKALGWVRDDFIKGEAVIVPASEEGG